MDNRDQRRASGGSSLSTEQTIVAWAAVVMGAVFMVAGGVAMFLSLS